jgi:hypothetical protein
MRTPCRSLCIWPSWELRLSFTSSSTIEGWDTARHTWTSRFWGSLWARSMTCSSLPGAQNGSVIIKWEASTRIRPPQGSTRSLVQISSGAVMRTNPYLSDFLDLESGEQWCRGLAQTNGITRDSLAECRVCNHLESFFAYQLMLKWDCLQRPPGLSFYLCVCESILS